MSPFQEIKLLLVENLHLAKDALHIYIAVLVFFASCLLFGWRVSQLRPLLVVLIVALAGEAWDLRDELSYGELVRITAHVKDIVNTLAVPALLWILARFTQLFDRKTR